MSKEKGDRNREIYELATLKDRSTGDLAEEFRLTPPRVWQIIHFVGQQRYGKHLPLDELRRRERDRQTQQESRP